MARADVAGRIAAWNRGRDPERLALKYQAMQASAFGFFRGAAHLFWETLPRDARLARSPVVWSCGDLHLANFGVYKGESRLVYFDVNDFDEAGLAPAACDLVRMATSVLVAAEGLEISKAEARTLCNGLLDRYASSLTAGKARQVERQSSRGLLRELFDAVEGRSRGAFLEERVDMAQGGTKLRIDGKRTLPASASDREAAVGLVSRVGRKSDTPAFFSVLDVARRVAGLSSLGLQRYVVLVRGRGGPAGHYLLDLKQAVPSSLVPRVRTAQPSWSSEAARIVTAQQRIQASEPALLAALELGTRSFVLKELQPTQDRVDVERYRSKPKRLAMMLESIADAVAWGHLRASGRGGTATADALEAFGRDDRWRDPVMVAAREMRDETLAQWRQFRAAGDPQSLV